MASSDSLWSAAIIRSKLEALDWLEVHQSS
jgi:hypothetical protein